MVDSNFFYKTSFLNDKSLKILRESYNKNKSSQEFFINDNISKLINKVKLDENYHQLLEDNNINLIDIFAKNYPSNLKIIENFPLCFYYKTNLDLSILRKPKIAIVGSRAPSLANISLTKKLTEFLNNYDFVIVSGLARGIDSIAHEYAKETIAVLGASIDNIYPSENKLLAHEICDKGALISEYPLGTKPLKKNFPMRNRIIAALADIVIIIEAKINSGSMITAKYALSYNKEIFAIPGHPLDYKVAGCNKLIKEGAYLLDDFREVIEIYNKANPQSFLKVKKDQEEATKNKDFKISEIENKILSLLSEQPITDEELLRKININPSDLKQILANLELNDFIFMDRYGKISRHFTNK